MRFDLRKKKKKAKLLSLHAVLVESSSASKSPCFALDAFAALQI